PGFAKIEPDFSSWLIIEFVDPIRRLRMKPLEHLREARCIGRSFRRMAHEMIMVRKNRPRFESPTELLCNSKQTSMQHAQAFGAAKMVPLEVDAGRQKISTALTQLVEWSVRPGGPRERHAETLGKKFNAGKQKATPGS